MADMATLLRAFVTTLGGTPPTSDDMSTLLTAINAALGGSIPSALPTAQSLSGSTVSLTTGSPATILTTASLTPGKYRISGAVQVLFGGATTACDVGLAVGTATATFSGAPNGGVVLAAAAADRFSIPFDALVTVTVAGTIILQGEAVGAAATAEINGTSFNGVTGLVIQPLASTV